MSERKPDPLTAVPARRLCPVCGKVSFSQSGEHPQCAVARADSVMKAALKASGAASGPPLTRQPWSKQCPRCHRKVPARRVTCDCGHDFIRSAGKSGDLPVSDVSA